MKEELATRFRLWRIAQALTLQEVADLVGLSESYVSLIERGRRTVSPTVKVQIARRLGVRVADLFEPTTLPDVEAALELETAP